VARHLAGEDKKLVIDSGWQWKMIQKGLCKVQAARKINFAAPVCISLGRQKTQCFVTEKKNLKYQDLR